MHRLHKALRLPASVFALCLPRLLAEWEATRAPRRGRWGDEVMWLQVRLLPAVLFARAISIPAARRSLVPSLEISRPPAKPPWSICLSAMAPNQAFHFSMMSGVGFSNP